MVNKVTLVNLVLGFAVLLALAVAAGALVRLHTVNARVEALEQAHKRIVQEERETAALLNVVIAGSPHIDKFLRERLAQEKAAGLR